MEEKLEELKRQWCKFYCEYKGNPETEIKAECNCPVLEVECDDCNCITEYTCEEEVKGVIYPCEHCQVENYIRFIKYDL